MNLITLTDITKIIGEGENSLAVLTGINLEIRRGEFVAIKGQSGSGKTTLMNIIGCLTPYTSGSYKLEEVETADMNPDALAELRNRKFGFIFQRYNLLDAMNAVDNVAIPAVYAGLPEAERRKRAAALLYSFGLKAKLQSRPNELSGGQQQRVSIARALMNGGEIFLADEPTGALDLQNGRKVMQALSALNVQGHTIILVTHDDKIAAYAERMIEIQDGKIVGDHRVRERKAVTFDFVPTVWQKKDLAYYTTQLLESFRMSIQALLSQKLRSLLTVLGIIIGTASIVTVVAIGRGSHEKITAEINAIGTNTIDIRPGTGFGDMQAYLVRTLSATDASLLSNQPYLSGASPVVNTQGMLVFRNTSATVLVNGVGEKYFDIKGIRQAAGRLFMHSDVRDNNSIAVIDAPTKEKLFHPGENPLGQIIIVNKKPLEIVGITQRQNGPYGMANLNIWVPYTTLMHKISGSRDINFRVMTSTEEILCTI